MIVKSSLILSKWHRNLGHPEIILSTDNGKQKSMDKEKPKNRRVKNYSGKNFLFFDFAEEPWQELLP